MSSSSHYRTSGPLFDDALVERGRELYAEVVRVSQSLGVQPYTDAIDDILKLEELIGEARGLRDSGTEVVPPNILLLAPELTNTAWELLNPDARSTLSGLAVQLEILGRGRAIEAALGSAVSAQEYFRQTEPELARIKRTARDVIEAALRDAARRRVERGGRLGRLIVELTERLASPHKFDVFAEGTVNFGLLLTFRQSWRPITYQAGKLVKTIPLAPSENFARSRSSGQKS